VQRLAGKLGIEIFAQHGAGRNLLDVGGKRRRYRGMIPRLDRETLAEWCERNVRTEVRPAPAGGASSAR